MGISTQYIAGIFDGEGTVGIYSYGSSPSPVLAIAGNHLPMLEAVRDHFGFGMVYRVPPAGAKDGAHRNPVSGRFQIRRWDECVAFLTEVRPYLMEKAEQADVFLAAAAVRPNGRRHTKESRQAMEEFAVALRTLKKPHNYANPT